MSTAVPTFYLYGEPQRAVEPGFVHVESLDDRSRPSEWTIQPHIHRDLNHVILICEGGGAMRADGDTVSFDAPSLLLVPAGIIHGFTWLRDSLGWVTTISDSYLRHLLARDDDLQPLFRGPHAISLPPVDFTEAQATIQRMARELAWAAPGQRGAIEALLLGLLVQALRHAAVRDASAGTSGRQTRLVARLRERIEQRFRERDPVAAHALALGVSETTLRQACRSVAGMSPAAMVDERALLEARRLLIYSNLSIAEIAYAIGFDDPAYFSRFFTRHVGRSPRDWRADGRRTDRS